MVGLRAVVHGRIVFSTKGLHNYKFYVEIIYEKHM